MCFKHDWLHNYRLWRWKDILRSIIFRQGWLGGTLVMIGGSWFQLRAWLCLDISHFLSSNNDTCLQIRFRSKPWFWMLIVEWPRRHHREHRQKTASQSNPHNKINILLTEADQKCKNLANVNNCHKPVSIHVSHTDVNTNKVFEIVSTRRCPWKSYADMSNEHWLCHI